MVVLLTLTYRARMTCESGEWNENTERSKPHFGGDWLSAPLGLDTYLNVNRIDRS